MSTKPDPSVIDQNVIDGLRRLFQDQSQAQVFLNDLIRTFRDSGATTLAAINGTLTNNDLPSLAKHAHRLKGIGRNIGAVRLGQVCAELEITANQAPLARVQELCAKADREFHQSCSELSDFYYRDS